MWRRPADWWKWPPTGRPRSSSCRRLFSLDTTPSCSRQAGAGAVDPTGPELAPLREACARRGVAAVVGVCLARRDGVTNSRVVIGNDGELRGIYDKIHLWTTEQPYFLPGGRRLLIELAGFQVGIAICYDAGFP